VRKGINVKNRFKPNSMLSSFTNLDWNYKKSGYDRGHQMDVYDCGCDSTAMAESFYYSNNVLLSMEYSRHAMNIIK
jgi:DNA/RNA endonuclease G (NUC1)